MPTALTYTFRTSSGLELAFSVNNDGVSLRMDTPFEEGSVSTYELLSVDELVELRTLLGTLLKQASKSMSSSAPSSS